MNKLVILMAATLLAGAFTAANGEPDRITPQIKAAEPEYSTFAAERREVLENAKASLDQLDARLERLEESAEEKRRETAAELRRQREIVVDRYVKLKQATEDQWESALLRFRQSIETLEARLNRKEQASLRPENVNAIE